MCIQFIVHSAILYSASPNISFPLKLLICLQLSGHIDFCKGYQSRPKQGANPLQRSVFMECVALTKRYTFISVGYICSCVLQWLGVYMRLCVCLIHFSCFNSSQAPQPHPSVLTCVLLNLDIASLEISVYLRRAPF